VSLSNGKKCCEISEDKIIAVCEKMRVYGAVSFGFELSVFESVGSQKNISVPRHAERNTPLKIY
jgi:hypothetical protein